MNRAKVPAQGLVSLRTLEIRRCNKLTGLTEDEASHEQSALVQRSGILPRLSCSKLTGHTKEEASDEQSAPERSGTLPRLESLVIDCCESLVQVPNLSTSLKTLHIEDCKSLKSIAFGEQDTTGLVSGEGVVQRVETSSSLIAAGSSSNEDESTVSTAVVLKLSSSSASSNHCFFPCLESLGIYNCSVLTEVANLPPSIKILGSVTSLEELHIRCKSLESLPHQVYSSLRVLSIGYCEGIKQLLPRLQQCLGHLEKKNLYPHLLQEQVEFDSKTESMSDGASTSVVLKQSSPTGSNHCFFPCLETLEIDCCDGLTEVANLPSSIKTLTIWKCRNLVSLSGEVPSLEELNISHCASLQFLPNGPHQVYSSLRVLRIKDCGGVKQLPPSLQQRLDHLEKKKLDPHLLQGPTEPVPAGRIAALMSKLACFRSRGVSERRLDQGSFVDSSSDSSSDSS